MSVRRLAMPVAVGLAMLVCGCGGSENATRAKPDGDVSAQQAARTLLAQLDEGGCDCTGEARAQARIDNGLAAASTRTVTVTADEP